MRNLLLWVQVVQERPVLQSKSFLTHTTNRLGKIDEGNTVMDFDPEEISKKCP